MTTDDAWERAVTLGSRGRYLESWAVLDARGREDAPALTLRASHLRQIGEGESAMAGDRSALLIARDQDERADARIGMAADLLCAGDAHAAARELDAAAPDALAAGWRTSTRLAWVRAEVALAGGDVDSALRQAGEAARLSAPCSARHEAKSRIIRAAALLSPGATGTDGEAGGDSVAEGLADLIAAAATLRQAGLATLQWPAALVALDALERGTATGRSPGASQALARLVVEGRSAASLIAEHLPPDLAARWLGRPDVVRLAATDRE